MSCQSALKKLDMKSKPYSASFTSLQISESFDHFRSVSYFEALTNASPCGSWNALGNNARSAKGMRIPSSSTPCTPKKIEIEKYSTLPVGNSGYNPVSSKKTRSSSLSSFFRRLKPKFRRSGSDAKNPWIVIEFSPHNGGELSSGESDESDQSLELAVESKVRHFTSLKDLNESPCNCSLSNRKRDGSTPECASYGKFDPSRRSRRHESEGSVFFRLSPRRHFENLKLMLKRLSKHPKYRNSSSTRSLDSGCAYKSESCIRDLKLTSHVLPDHSQIENGRASSPVFHFCRPSKQANLKNCKYLSDFNCHLRVPISQSSNASLASVLEDRGKQMHDVPFNSTVTLPPICMVAFDLCGLEMGVTLGAHPTHTSDPEVDGSFAGSPITMAVRIEMLHIKIANYLRILTTQDLLCTDGSSPKRARPPGTLVLSGKTFREQRALGIYRKMASVESIGACSLDFDVSANEDFAGGKPTASNCSLLGHGLTPSVGGLSGNGRSDDTFSKEQRLPEISKLTNGHKRGDKREYAVAEIKLPSYVSISCAINGYTNYSRFCRSRDNSPARSSFRKSSLEPSMPSESVDHTTSRYSRSHSDSNGTMHSVYTESKHVTVNKQLQIPLKSTKLYRTEVTLERRESDISERTTPEKTIANGHSSEKLILAKEVGIGGTKSLVQQRIESLYGKSVGEEVKICGKPSNRVGEPRVNGIDSPVPSQNGIPNGKSHKGSTSPPVFRHLNEDFRKQLQASVMEEKKSVSSEKKNSKSERKSFEKNSPPRVLKENGHSPLIDEMGHDECDRVKSKTPPPKLSHVSFTTDKSEREGYKFLNVVDTEKEKILVNVKQLEAELRSDPNIPEDACGKIRAACGKANLLVTQKFEQFKGLCWKNIEENPNVPFYTTASDLAGFWDMVMLQVNDIDATFQEIEAMRANNWKEVSTPKPAEIKPRIAVTAVSKSNPNTPKRSAKSVELAKAREEARKQLLAAKKKGRQQHVPKDADIAIFTPASSNQE